MFLKKNKPTSLVKVLLPDDTELALSGLQRSSTLFEVKQSIEKAAGIKADQQFLHLTWNESLILSDEKQLADYGLLSDDQPQHGALDTLVLHVSANPILVRVNLSHSLQKHGGVQKQPVDTGSGQSAEELEIQTFPNCSVFCLKVLVSSRAASPVCDQVLIYRG